MSSTIAEEYTKVEAQELQEAKMHEMAAYQDRPPATPQQETSGASALMNIIDRLATMPNLDDAAIDRVERLFGMHQEMLAKQQEQTYNTAMAAAQNEIQTVARNKSNSHTKSSYADLAAIHDQAKPVWTKHGFSVSSWIDDSTIQGMIRVCCEVRHSGGHKNLYGNSWPIDDGGFKGNSNKTPIQAMGSSSSYARRYTECMVFDIAMKDDNDGNNAKQGKSSAHQSVTNAQIRIIREHIKAAGVTEEWFCAEAQVPRIEELQQGRIKGCIGVLQGLAKQKKGGTQ